MARKTLTLDEVLAARDQLRAEGQSPSVRAIRNRIGYGSLTTILKLMAEAQDAQASAPKGTFELSNSLLNEIHLWVADIVLKATTECCDNQTTLQKTCAELAHENGELTQQLDEQRSEINRLENDNSRALGQIAQLREDYEAVKRDLERERETSEALRRELTLATFKAEGVAQLECQLAQTGDDALTSNARRIELEKICAILEVQNQTLSKAESGFRTRIEQMEQDMRVLREQIYARSSQLADARVEIATTKGALALAEEVCAERRRRKAGGRLKQLGLNSD